MIIIGLDLSFNSTGITVYNKEKNTMILSRVVFGDSVKTQANVNTIAYTLPKNINTKDLLVDSEQSKNTIEQVETTLKAMMCSKTICKELSKYIKHNCEGVQTPSELTQASPQEIVLVFENYIMPSFGGPNALKNVAGLIMLQGFIREWCILGRVNEMNIKIMTPTPSAVKKSFTGNGKADKSEMEKVFIDKYEGYRLIPEYNTFKCDDIIDSFALVCYGLQHTH